MQTDELNKKLAALPAERVTEQAMGARIKDARFLRDETTTICILELDNGFKVVGHSTPASPENFNEEIGEHYAYEDAFKQLWRLFGFLLVEKKHLAAKLVLPLCLLFLAGCSIHRECHPVSSDQTYSYCVTTIVEPAVTCTGSCKPTP